MQKMGEVSPWLSMWRQPRKTIRTLLYTESNSRTGLWQGGAQNLSQAKPVPKQLNLKSLAMQGDLKGCGCPTQPEPILESRAVYTHPKSGVFFLAALFALENLFFFANWWSLGISVPFSNLLLVSLAASPIAGMIWLFVSSWIFCLTGRWFHGKASSAHLRTAIAWSRLPVLFSLLIWFLLLAAYPDTVFIQDGGEPSSLLINSVSLIIAIWSFVLLVQSIREVQSFSLIRSLVNIALAWIVSSIISFLMYVSFRYLYLLFY